MKKILHIAPHLGGGAGKAISGMITCLTEYNNTLLLLEEPIELKHVNKCIDSGIKVIITTDYVEINNLINNSDAVIINWWGHPLMVTVLNIFSKVKTRLMIWSHINGLSYPYLTYEFINMFDEIAFTSKCSYENPTWNSEQVLKIKSKSSLVLGFGDFNPEKINYKNNYCIKQMYKVGYIGTLSFSKINTLFPEICKDIKSKIKCTEFILCGNYDNEFYSSIKQDKYIFESTVFTGFISDVNEKLVEFDLFCYPLAEENFATTENSILEAMAAALPIIVMDNPAERSIISHDVTGLIAKNSSEVSYYACELYKNRSRAAKLGRNAREFILSTYKQEDNTKVFKDCIQRLFFYSKSNHDFESLTGKSAGDFFIYFSGKDSVKFMDVINGKELTINPIYYNENKGSPFHYLKYYPDDKLLRLIVDKISKSFK